MMIDYQIFEVHVVDFNKPVFSNGEISGYETKTLKIQAANQSEAEQQAIYLGYKLNLIS